MKFRFLIIYILANILFAENTIVHIKSTYFDGTPKEIIIYEYSNLYQNKPLKILDTLSFDKDEIYYMITKAILMITGFVKK